MYLVIKSLHLIFVVAWFAGLFYIFRLFVYHVENQSRPDVTSVFEVMERRLFSVIILPASVATLFFGLLLSYLNPSVWYSVWFWLKLALLIALFSYQFHSWRIMLELRAGRFLRSSKYCRTMNEVPTIILFLVVFLVVMKPIFRFMEG